MPNATIQLVWYRRDLRVQDHAPLLRAARRGPVLPLFVVEPEPLRRPDLASRHWTFARDALRELRASLAALGQPLVVRTGPLAAVLNALHEVAPVAAIWTHEETGLATTAARLQAARDWTTARGIPYHELPQDGVIRGERGRNRWAPGWAARIGDTALPPPDALPPLPNVAPGTIPTHQALSLPPDDRPVAGPSASGGATAGKALLDTFLTARGAGYPAALDDPLRAPELSSRLGPHLAWGTLSPRQIIAATQSAEERADSSALVSRLRARDRALQRLHDTPHLASASPHPALDELRATDLPDLRDGQDRADRLAAWRAGETGYPMIDAAMRQLRVTGWLPYPLRALIVAFATHALWLPWQRLDPFLAQQWLDYEPGVHLDQLQHHAGVGPAAPPRLPDPVAYGQAHDLAGAYVRRWLPALRDLPADYAHQPWLLPVDEQARLGCQIGRHYPAPIIDQEAVSRAARAALTETRRRPTIAAALAAARAAIDTPQPKAQQMSLF